MTRGLRIQHFRNNVKVDLVIVSISIIEFSSYKFSITIFYVYFLKKY
jgi:hypothetical protein